MRVKCKESGACGGACASSLHQWSSWEKPRCWLATHTPGMGWDQRLGAFSHGLQTELASHRSAVRTPHHTRQLWVKRSGPYPPRGAKGLVSLWSQVWTALYAACCKCGIGAVLTQTYGTKNTYGSSMFSNAFFRQKKRVFGRTEIWWSLQWKKMWLIGRSILLQYFRGCANHRASNVLYYYRSHMP